jgi:uncharacterized protein (DUF58 family)
VTETPGLARDAFQLRRDAERIGGSLPPLLADATHLASTVAMGVHGRRRAGRGETFWQYRQAMPGDVLSDVDWRRSARSDALFIRQMEWEAAQAVTFWADDAQSMDYRSDPVPRTKGQRARLLALALSVLLVKAGERVSLAATEAAPPRTGETQLRRMALAMARGRAERPDYGTPPAGPFSPGGKAVFLSDFLGPTETLMPALARATAHSVTGCLVQIVDPTEETFPFDGRTIFESMGRQVEFETQRARALRAAYQDRLAERREALAGMARRSGWQFLVHRTSESPRKALLWLYMGLGELH